MTVQKTGVNVADFEDYMGLPENDGRRFELINGEIVEKAPTEAHGTYTANIAAELHLYKRQYGGRVLTQNSDAFVPADQVIEGGDVLPAFSLALRDIFAD